MSFVLIVWFIRFRFGRLTVFFPVMSGSFVHALNELVYPRVNFLSRRLFHKFLLSVFITGDRI